MNTVETLTSSNSTAATLILLAVAVIFVMATFVIPYLLWHLHRQIAGTRRELIRLNVWARRINTQMAPEEKHKESPIREIRAEKMVEEILGKPSKKVPAEKSMSELAAEGFRRRKVFIKPEDHAPYKNEKTG